MAKRNSTSPKARKPRLVAVHYREYSEIERDLSNVKCALACASIALGQAQDRHDGELGVQAWNVIHNCVGKLGRVENDLDAWHVVHEHSLKAVSNGR